MVSINSSEQHGWLCSEERWSERGGRDGGGSLRLPAAAVSLHPPQLTLQRLNGPTRLHARVALWASLTSSTHRPSACCVRAHAVFGATRYGLLDLKNAAALIKDV